MISGLYSYGAVRDQMKKHFKINGHILLNDFLLKEVYAKLDFKENVRIYRPDKYSYSNLDLDNDLIKFLQSDSFLNLILEITGEKFSEIEMHAKKFKRGDYSLINDDELPEKGLQFVFIISERWNEGWGGQSIFTYGDGDPLVFPVKGNSLILIKNNGKLFDFTKYIKHFAGQNEIIKIEGRLVAPTRN